MGLRLRGFLSQDKEVTTRRIKDTQGGADAGLRQKYRNRKPIFGEINYNML